VTGWGRLGGRSKDGGREWLTRGRKNSRREQYKKRGKSKGGENRDKKTVMVKLIIQKKKPK
jgi:hypothetical protein